MEMNKTGAHTARESKTKCSTVFEKQYTSNLIHVAAIVKPTARLVFAGSNLVDIGLPSLSFRFITDNSVMLYYI